MQNMRSREAILKVLHDSGQPVHYAAIAQAIFDNGYRTNVGATPAATVAANLSQPPLKNKVLRVATGTYALRSQPSKSEGMAPAETVDTAEPDAKTVASTEESDEMGFINAFGMFWRRSEVDWSSRNPILLGVQQSGSQQVDFGKQAGVYLLYDGGRVVYVGRVTETRMGQRMWEHNSRPADGPVGPLLLVRCEAGQGGWWPRPSPHCRYRTQHAHRHHGGTADRRVGASSEPSSGRRLQCPRVHPGY